MTQTELLALLAHDPVDLCPALDLKPHSLKHRAVTAMARELIGLGLVRAIRLGAAQCYVHADWQPSRVWFVDFLESLCERDGDHLLWGKHWDSRLLRADMKFDGKKIDPRRLLWALHTGHTLRRNESVRAKCDHERCMTLSHLRVVPLGAAMAGRHVSIPTRIKLQKIKRARGKHSAELISSIRASELSYTQISARTGVPLGTVGAVKSGRIWRDYASPFAGLMR